MKLGTTPAGTAEGDKNAALTGFDQAFRQAADAKEVPGVVAVAATGNGVPYEGAFGKRDLAKGTDMTLDSVFWIASMTKALTATAAMQLVEQGKLQLDEPMGKLLPELAAPQVLEGFNDKANRSCVRPSGRSRCACCSPTPPASLRHLGRRHRPIQQIRQRPGDHQLQECGPHDPARFRSRRAEGVRHQHRLRRQGGRGGQRTESRGLASICSSRWA